MNGNYLKQENVPVATPLVQPIPGLTPIPIQVKSPKSILVIMTILIILSFLLSGFLIYQNSKLRQEINTQPQNTDRNTISPTLSPTSTSTSTPKDLITPIPTSKPTSTPTIRSFEEEEELMRKTLAGFEMYIGARNTAGALSFFTPPKTDSAKEKYESIRTKNLPDGLKSWGMVTNTYGKLAVEEIKGGYRARVNECKINSSSCSLLFLELVRDDSAENSFSVDRYYTSSYGYQNNLGEEIKYQGFGL